MKCIQLCCLIAVAFLLGAIIVPRPQPAVAEVAAGTAATTPPLQIVTYSSGLTGFFDPASRKLYVYAADFRTPFTTVQVDTLGQPLRVLRPAPQ